MKRSPLPRPRKPIARSPIKKRPRKPAEFARIYGSKARVEFVKSLPCAACGVVGYSENAHLLGNGGMGRKADADTIGPLCCDMTVAAGCHRLFDEYRYLFDLKYPDFDPERVARETEELWRASLGFSPGGHQK